MFIRYLASGLVVLSASTMASCGDGIVRSYVNDLFAGKKAATPHATKAYPILEQRYIKQFAGPRVACDACFGYHHTQWRTWADACGEPVVIEQPVAKPMNPVVEPAPAPKVMPKKSDAAPTAAKSETPMAVPTPVNPPIQPVPPKKEETNPSKSPSARSGINELPKLIKPEPANVVRVEVPQLPELVSPGESAPVLPPIPSVAIPTLIVPLNSK